MDRKLPHFFTNTHSPAFACSRQEIEKICRFFTLGKCRSYKKEKSITFAHFNPFIFVETTQGQYGLKFFEPQMARAIALEYSLNRRLIDHGFATPLMHIGHDGHPFFPLNGRLAVCYSYIKGPQAWKSIKQRSIFTQINAAMLSLKIGLSVSRQITLPKAKSLTTTINTLVRDSKRLDCHELDAFLLGICRTYQQHQQLFTRQALHSNTHLDNFLIHQKKIYTLDLSHVQEDYILVDLRGVIISCLLLGTPDAIIKNIIKDYLKQHSLSLKYVPVLAALVNIWLIEEYLKILACPPAAGGKYQKTIMTALNKTKTALRL